jgi:hypothetical protein
VSRIVVVCTPLQRSQLESTILRRESFDVGWYATADAAFQEITRTPPDLLIAHLLGDGATLLDRIRSALPGARFPIIALYDDQPPAPLPGLRATVPAAFDRDHLDREVAHILGLPGRRAHRYRVQAPCRLDDPRGVSVMAQTVDLSTSGVLLECSRPLEIGSVYALRFMTVRSPTLSLRVVRDATAPGVTRLRRFAGEFVDAPAEGLERTIRALVPGQPGT